MRDEGEREWRRRMRDGVIQRGKERMRDGVMERGKERMRAGLLRPTLSLLTVLKSYLPLGRKQPGAPELEKTTGSVLLLFTFFPPSPSPSLSLSLPLSLSHSLSFPFFSVSSHFALREEME